MKLYHITEKSNLNSILKKGLLPKIDKWSGLKIPINEPVINLIAKKDLHEVLDWCDFKSPVLLEINLNKNDAKRVIDEYANDIEWYICTNKIPASKIKSMRIK